ncbi:MAG: helix-turn-helix domain-containing protein [Sphingobacteriales bacterium]
MYFILSKQCFTFVLYKYQLLLHPIYGISKPLPEQADGGRIFIIKALKMTAIELITREDLKAFKSELLEDIKAILQPGKVETKQWLKSAEVRKVLKISPGTLQNLRINGKLRFSKIGGMMYYKMEDIQKLLEGGHK